MREVYEPIEIVDVRLTVASPGYASILRRVNERLVSHLKNLEADRSEKETIETRARIRELRAVLSIPEQIEAEWKSKN
jgi:hypothetical protein